MAEPPAVDLDDRRVLAVVATSAATGAGIDALTRALFEFLPDAAPAPAEDEEMADFLVYRPRPPRRRSARIFRTDRGYRVRGQASDEDLRAVGIKPEDVVEFEDG